MSMVSRLLACLLLVWHFTAMGVEVVRFPRPEFEGDRRYDYAMQLLQLALSKTATEYRIQPAEIAMNQERQVLEIEAGRTIDVGPIPIAARAHDPLSPEHIALRDENSVLIRRGRFVGKVQGACRALTHP